MATHPVPGQGLPQQPFLYCPCYLLHGPYFKPPKDGVQFCKEHLLT